MTPHPPLQARHLPLGGRLRIMRKHKNPPSHKGGFSSKHGHFLERFFRNAELLCCITNAQESLLHQRAQRHQRPLCFSACFSFGYAIFLSACFAAAQEFFAIELAGHPDRRSSVQLISRDFSGSGCGCAPASARHRSGHRRSRPCHRAGRAWRCGRRRAGSSCRSARPTCAS
jgi:hypothetical protein